MGLCVISAPVHFRDHARDARGISNTAWLLGTPTGNAGSGRRTPRPCQWRRKGDALQFSTKESDNVALALGCSSLQRALLAVPAAVFVLEITSVLVLPERLQVSKNDCRVRATVIIPAHDEASGIQDTLEDIKLRIRPTDRILVIADNCTDDTASIAKKAGTEVIERSDLVRQGKGHALLSA